MADRLEVAPYDPLTGVTCAIAPAETVPLPASPENGWHHTNHPGSFLRSRGLSGRAIRSLRLQLTPNEDHNKGGDSYHDWINRSKVPRTKSSEARLVVCTLAGAIPSEVLVPRERTTRPIREEERQRLFRSGEIAPQSTVAASLFLTAFVAEFALDCAKKASIERFLHAKHRDERASVGNDIFDRLLPVAFKPIDDRYREAKEAGIIPISAPDSPAEIARQYVFSEQHRFILLGRALSENPASLWSLDLLEQHVSVKIAA